MTANVSDVTDVLSKNPSSSAACDGVTDVTDKKPMTGRGACFDGSESEVEGEI